MIKYLPKYHFCDYNLFGKNKVISYTFYKLQFMKSSCSFSGIFLLQLYLNRINNVLFDPVFFRAAQFKLV